MTTRELGSLVVRVKGTLDELQKSLSQAQKKVNGFASRMSTIGSRLSVLSAPMAGIAAGALKLASDFEASMNKVSALGDITGESLKKLENQALQLGTSTQFSAKEAADGMADLAAAGFDTTKIMASMPGVLDLAAAAQVSVARASEIAVSTLGAFQMGAEKAGEVADILASGAARGVLSIDDLAESLKYVAPIANTTGRSLEETVAAITLLSNAGIKGSQAGTSLRMGMIRFVKPTKQAREVIEELGLTLTDGAGKIKPLADIIGQLSSKQANLAQITKLVGIEASTAWMNLVNQGAPALAKLTEEIDKDIGASNRMAETLKKGLGGSFKELKNSVINAGIAIGTVLAPAAISIMEILKSVADKVTDLAIMFKELPFSVQITAGTLLGFATILGPLIVSIGFAAKVVLGLVSAFRLGISVFLLALTPIGAVGVAIAALGALAYTLYQNWEPLKALFKPIFEEWYKDFDNGLTIIEKQLDEWHAGFARGLDVIGNYFIETKDKLIKTASEIYEGIKTWLVDKLTGAFDLIGQKVDEVYEYFHQLKVKLLDHSPVPDIYKGVTTTFERMCSEMVGTTKKGTGKVYSSFDDLSSGLSNTMGKLEGQISEFSSKLAGLFGMSDGGVFDGLISSFFKGENTGGLGGAFAEVIGDIFGRGKTANEQISSVAKGIGELFGYTFSDTSSAVLKDGVMTLMNGDVVNASGEVIKKFDEITGSVSTGATEFMGYANAALSAVDAVAKIGKTTKDTIAGVTEVAGTAIGSFFGGPAGGQVGNFLGEKLGSLLGGLFGGGTKNPETKARQAIEKLLEDKLGANVKFGSSGRFNQPGWADAFNAKEYAGSFSALGSAITGVEGVVENVGPHIGAILHEHVNGNLDKGRAIVKQLGYSLENLTQGLMAEVERGKLTWHEYNVKVAELNQLFGEGRSKVNDLKGAVDAIAASGGKGMGVLKDLRDVAVEALEAGAKTFEEAKAKAIADGADPEYVNAIFEAAAQRGVKTLEAMKGMSDATAGAIVGDMYAISTAIANQWTEQNKQLQEIQQTIASIPDEVTKSLTFEVDAKMTEAGQAALNASASGGVSTSTPVQQFARGGIVNRSTGFLNSGMPAVMGERGAEAILPLKRVGGVLGVQAAGGKGSSSLTLVINAQGAAQGTEERIRQVIRDMGEDIVRRAVQTTSSMMKRGAM